MVFVLLPHHGCGEGKISRCAHSVFGSALFDLIFVQIQYATANAAPLINKADSELAARTKTALENLPSGVEVKGADYPVLRIFASWPGEAGLDRTGEWKLGAPIDPDGHPLATLHLTNFRNVGKTLFQKWFGRDVEEKLVVKLKRAREEGLEEGDSIASRLKQR